MTSSSQPLGVSDVLALWSDDPAAVDLLSFDAIAEVVTDALLDDDLDPIALGVSGSWGSGKTTVLNLVANDLAARDTARSKVIVVQTDPWRYDPTTGAKESLITEVLDRLTTEVQVSETVGDRTKKLLKRLVGRINWSKAIRLAAKTTLALQLPSFDDLTDLVKDSEGTGEDDNVRGMEQFRNEFAELMESTELSHVKRVVVLVDDLDRCLPETVIDSLEAIRLFLAVPKMSFVLAADEDRVAEAIRTRFPANTSGGNSADAAEEPAKLYLHKIVQTTIRLPALSRFDTQAFLLLLQLQLRLTPAQMDSLVGQCQALRLQAGDLDSLSGLEGVDMSAEMAFADRLTPLLYEKLRGNPRRIKRFLNDLHVRQSIAKRRGISLDPALIAKLMMLEVLLPDEFGKVLDWLAQGVLRETVSRLESVALSPGAETETDPADEEAAPTPRETRRPARSTTPGQESEFSDGLIRWAKLPPAIGAEDLAAYLYLAAAFKGHLLQDKGLPERLQDISARLLSASNQARRSVGDNELAGISGTDAQLLLQHLGRMARDRPTDQIKAVSGMLRVVGLRSSTTDDAQKALLSIPPDEVSPATILLFRMPTHNALRPVLESWRDRTSRAPVRSAVDEALRSGGA